MISPVGPLLDPGQTKERSATTLRFLKPRAQGLSQESKIRIHLNLALSFTNGY